MTLEELCVARELAVRMAKLGWPQKGSLFIWVRRQSGNKWHLIERLLDGVYDGSRLYYGNVMYDAPTISEIAKELSHEIRIYPDTQWNTIEGFWFEGSLRKYHTENSCTSLVNSFGLYWCWWKEVKK